MVWYREMLSVSIVRAPLSDSNVDSWLGIIIDGELNLFNKGIPALTTNNKLQGV